jgi:tetratricopeptide (TPR) repeat protein/transcriptional regulator with XRE-family HTH domain
MRRLQNVTFVYVYASRGASAPLGRRRAVDIDIDDHGAWQAVQVQRCAWCLYVQTRGQESALCTCATGYRPLSGGVRLVYDFAVGDLQGVGLVTTGKARGSDQRARRTSNQVLRDIRENERHETRAEFAEAMSRVAREMGEEVYPDENYVQRLESGAISWPHTVYRNVLVKLCDRPAVELGFTPPMLSVNESVNTSDETPERINTQLRDAIWASGMELTEFARKVGVAPKTAERWITRGRLPQPRHRWKSAQILGRGESELWPHAVSDSEGPEKSSIVLFGQSQDALKPELSGLPSVLQTSLAADMMDAMKRRAFLMGAVTAAGFSAVGEVPLSMLIHESTAEAAGFITSVGQEVIDPLMIEQFFDEIRRLSVLYNSSTAGVDRQILEKATMFRGALQKLATVYRRPSQASDLYLMTGLLSGICAYACLDLGYPDEAMAQSRASFMMGDMVGHDGLRAWALGTNSLIARFQGRYTDALDYVRRGIQYATTGTALVRLRCGEGQTLAHMGDSANAIHYLNLAREAREHVASADIVDGLFSFSETKQTYYSGSSLQWLPGTGNAKAAEMESARAITMFQEAAPSANPSGDELLAHIYLGNSRLTLGEIEGSMEALRPVLDLPLPERNAWQRKRMQQVALRLETGNFSDSKLASEARDEISAFIDA